MCGIAGWLDKNIDITDKQKIIEKMSDTLKSRGPDADGVYTEHNICLIHRRLAVIDIYGGAQPMSAEFNNELFTIVYNGELYNTEDIRSELLTAGFEFKGHSDTEVLLFSYIHWGEKCLDKLNGIFAFAVWHSKEKKLFFARDPVGVKPLFFCQYSDGLIFGSEIKTILANSKIKAEINEEGFYELLFMSPGRTCGKGVFKGIYELEPGEFATYKNSVLTRRRYFSLKAHEHTDNLSQTIEKTRFLIKDAIRRQLVSDVPLCTFLSGGLDSSIISKVASDYYRLQGQQLTTYSINYTDNKKFFTKSLFQPNSDEEFIHTMVEFIGSEHREVVLDNVKLANYLFDAARARDLPSMADVDSSLLMFCKEIKKDYTVALSGECADELFGGYPWYHNEKILFEECFPWSRSLDIRRSILKDGFLPKGEEYVHQRYLDMIARADVLPSDTPKTKRMREMFALNFYGFMQNLLDRKDRMSMYNGLEVRVPFCDKRLVDFAYNLPWNLKAMNGREKGIIRTAMSEELPYEIVWRKKSPYPKTHNPIYMETVTNRLRQVLDDKTSPLHQFIDIDGVENIINHPEEISSPWYGQLMRAPQILAYLIQLDFWMREYL